MSKPFPVGRPQVLIGEDMKHITIKNKKLFFKNLELYHGLIFCTIKVPQNELFPFLQFRTPKNFNVLANCRECSIQLLPKCNHKDLARMYTSVWTLVEIIKALDLNYTIECIYEIHYFMEGKKILKDYLEKLISLRLQNSFAKGDKAIFAQEINTKLELSTNFKISPQNVENNSLNNFLYKLQANSALGKFSQNTFSGSFEIVRSLVRLEDIF